MKNNIKINKKNFIIIFLLIICIILIGILLLQSNKIQYTENEKNKMHIQFIQNLNKDCEEVLNKKDYKINKETLEIFKKINNIKNKSDLDNIIIKLEKESLQKFKQEKTQESCNSLLKILDKLGY